MARFTAKRFKELVEQLGLATQEEAADLLGIGRRSFIRYWNNQAPVPPGTRRLLLMLAQHGTLKTKEW